MMKRLSIIAAAAAAAGVMLSAMVFAAPLPGDGKALVAQAPDRAAAYLTATVD